MPTRAQVLQLVDGGLSFEEAAQRLGVNPGLAYMIATGLPADGGDTLTSGERARQGVAEGSSQALSNRAEPENPTRKQHVLSWIKSRAHSDPQMAAAAARRTAEPGERAAVEEDQDILTVLTRDHDHVTALTQQLSAIPGHKKGGTAAHIERRESIVDLITVALAQHESTEEEYFWPTVRQTLDNGDELAEKGLGQEQEGNEVLKALARSDADSDEFDELVERLIMLLRKHVSFEDRVLLALREALPEDERAKLGGKFRTAKQAAPTRAHPHAPRHSAATTKTAGMPAAAMDKVRDAVGERPADREGKAESDTESG